MISAKDAARFWSKVDRSGGPDACWPWMACRLNKRGGYGQFMMPDKLWYAHLFAFALEHGAPPTNLGCHSCDNPPCCNPKHIFDGTYKQNAQDAAKKGRMGKWDRRGWRGPNHKLKPQQVMRIRELLKQGAKKAHLAMRYRVSTTAISYIQMRRLWKHLG